MSTIDSNTIRKNKIRLADYDYKSDIQNRLLLSQLSPIDVEILEEILYSPLAFPIKRLLTNLDYPIETVQKTLELLAPTQLFELDGEIILVNKERRKYFETQIIHFEDGFEPDMDFLQVLMKKVPIHILPTWYHIPRTSNNIFESIIEKYLITPQAFQRYLLELNMGDEVLNSMTADLLQSPELYLSTQKIRDKYHLSKEELEEYTLLLEFNFIGCKSYRSLDHSFEEIITPFREWREYLEFLRESTPPSLSTAQSVKRYRPSDFSFIEDMTELVKLNKKAPLSLQPTPFGLLPEDKNLEEFRFMIASFDTDQDFLSYTAKLIEKMVLLSLVSIDDSMMTPQEESNFWLTLTTEKQALLSYKNHYVALITDTEGTAKLFNERNLHQLEKNFRKISESGWIQFDDFMKGVTIALSEESKVELRKVGRRWQYTLPSYTEDEKMLIQTVVLDWLFQAGLIALGSFEKKTCFCITELGKKIFTP
ncbi:MAG: hypothetical protein WDZ28_04795 [Simkaniaceae bacterium]